MGAVDDPHAQRGHGLHLLIGPLLVGLALAAPRAAIDAEVGPDLDYVRGTLTVDAALVSVRDPLAALPMPEEDRTGMRTFPGPAEQGTLTWTEVAPGKYTFHAWLPRRFGGIGATRHGLFANGGWYPQPIVDGEELPLLDWEVRVSGPEDVVMALGSSVGGSEVRWTGTAERASLAVVPDGVVERIEGTRSYVVARKRVRKALKSELSRLLQEAVPELGAPAVIVEAPLRRRLARSGPGQGLISDRAFRVFPAPLRRFHRVGIARELLPAFVPLADPVHRAWVGASWAEDWAASLSGPGAPQLSEKVRWIPSVDFLLTSRTMPFYGEILERRYVEDPLRDDLAEIFDPHYPGPAVVQLLDDASGEGTHRAVAAVLLAGAELDEAIPAGERAGELLPGWRAAVPEQDYRLTVDDGRAVVTRDAPLEAPAEIMRIRVDDELVEWVAGPGPDVWARDRGFERLVLDPGGHLRQRSRVGDAFPARYRLTGGGWIDNINLSEGRLSAALQAQGRRSGDLRNSVFGSLATSETDLARARVGYVHRFGHPLDGVRRAHRLALTTTAGWHHPFWCVEVGTRYSLGAGASWSWSNRVSASHFPMRGSYLTFGSSVGFAPDKREVWGGFGSGAGTLVSWHPRWALDMGVKLGGAFGEGETRKLPLGGLSAVRGLDPALTARGTLRSVQSMELRWAPVRNASVPVLLAWGTELQLGAGLEVAEVLTEEGIETAAGAVLGAFVLGDAFGLEPRGAGLTVGLPLLHAGDPVRPRASDLVFLVRWGPNL